MFLNFTEIIDIVLMSLIIGFIFKGFFDFRRENVDVMKMYTQRFDWSGIWSAIAVVAPAIILHEFGHKFVAMSFGLNATFNAAYFWLGVGVLMKLLSFGFIFFVPAYVSITGNGSHLAMGLTALAGPLVNLVLFLIALLVIKFTKVKTKYLPYWAATKRINLFLFIFNMIPIGFFDGAKVFSHLWQYFF